MAECYYMLDGRVKHVALSSPLPDLRIALPTPVSVAIDEDDEPQKANFDIKEYRLAGYWYEPK